MFNTNSNQETFRIVLKAFSDAAQKRYGDTAFEAGYLQSLATRMLTMIPKKYQRVFIDEMVSATQRQEQQVIKMMNENKTVEQMHKNNSFAGLFENL